MDILKFNGKFANLPKNGFVFGKLYASNYRCYMKNLPQFTPMLMVWVARRSVEISGYGSMSKKLIEFIKSIDWSTIPETTVWFGKSVRIYISENDEFAIQPFEDGEDMLPIFITENTAKLLLNEVELLTNGFYL